jgi:hypothetical protein
MRTSDPAASTTMSTGAQQRQRFFAGADRGDLGLFDRVQHVDQIDNDADKHGGADDAHAQRQRDIACQDAAELTVIDHVFVLPAWLEKFP